MPRRSDALSDEPVARRLALTRRALGYDRQDIFARDAGIGANVYNPWERGKRPLPLDGAQRLCSKYGLTIEWLYDGVPTRLPYGLVQRLIELGALPPPSTEPPRIIRKSRK